MPRTNETGSKQASILIVDDNVTNIDLLRRYLEGKPYDIATALSGEAALKILPRLKPDLVLLDVMMPGIDGFETCQRIRADPAISETAVIFVTAKTSPEALAEGFDSGGNDYICKPVQQQELFVRVNNQLLIQQNKTLERQQLEKQTAMAQLGSLVGTITHDVCSPLGIIKLVISSLSNETDVLQASMQQEELTAEELVHFIETAQQSLVLADQACERAIELLESFKVVAVDQCAMQQYRFAVKDYLQRIALCLTPKLKKMQCQLQITCDPAVEFYANPSYFSQIFTNLIENSLSHGFDKQQGSISIEVSQTEDGLTLVYRDDGKGIGKDKQEHVFDAYFTTKRGQGGSGLGLYIVQQLVTEQLGGKISLTSTEGKGVCFTISLPFTQAGPLATTDKQDMQGEQDNTATPPSE